MTIQPDTKDWTWVIEQPCPECGYDGSAVQPTDVAALVRQNVAAWPAVLAAADVRERPRPEVWSALEYGCHVRDVYRLFTRRLQLMLGQDDPLFANWDQDATAVEERYGTQDPAVVAGELQSAGEVMAQAFAAVGGAQWARTGRRSDGAAFTVESFARYLLHDPTHHLYDVRRARSGSGAGAGDAGSG